LVVTVTGLNGGMAERLKAPALKAGRGASPSGVRIPLPPLADRLTADTYGHLFPRGDDGAELAAAEKALLA
jgi:hypothetical protein